MSIKRKIITIMLIVSMSPINVFAASPQTKQMIHDTLAKYCIPPKKENCNPSQEGQYDPNYDFCLCNDDGMIYNKSDRICKDCRAGTYYRRDMKDNKCKSCSPGTYSGSGAASCTNCPAGSYASGYGNSACSSCWAGSYQPNSGQSSCLSCDSSSCMTSGTGATSCYFRCGGYTPYCSSGSCVECTSDSHCSYYCVSNSCVRCRYNSDCSGNYECIGGSCVCSLSESDCPCGMSGCSCDNCPEPEPEPEPDTGNDDGGYYAPGCAEGWHESPNGGCEKDGTPPPPPCKPPRIC